MRVFINFLLLFASVSCNSEKKPTDNGWDVVIKGKVNFPLNGDIQIQELKNGGSGTPELIQLNKDNTFSKTIHLTEPGIYGVNFYGKQAVNLMVDHSPIELNVDGNNQQGMAEIKGSPDHDLYQKVQMMYRGLQDAPGLKTIEAEFQKAAAANDEKKINELRAAYMKELEKGQLQIVELLKQQPPSLALFHLLQDPNLIDKDKNMDLFTTAVEKFKKS